MAEGACHSGMDGAGAAPTWVPVPRWRPSAHPVSLTRGGMPARGLSLGSHPLLAIVRVGWLPPGDGGVLLVRTQPCYCSPLALWGCWHAGWLPEGLCGQAGHPLLPTVWPRLPARSEGCKGSSRVLSLVMQMAAPSASQAERLREKGPFESWSNFPGEWELLFL